MYLKQNMVDVHGNIAGVKHKTFSQKTEEVVWVHGILLSPTKPNFVI